MTLTDLEKFVSEGQLGQSDYNLQTLLQKCKGKPFWLWLPGKHDRAMKEVKLGNRYAQIRPPNQCCFNHIIGLPRKNGVEHPLYDYRRIRNMLGADILQWLHQLEEMESPDEVEDLEEVV